MADTLTAPPEANPTPTTPDNTSVSANTTPAPSTPAPSTDDKPPSSTPQQPQQQQGPGSEQEAAQQGPAPAPVVITPVQPKGIAGVLQSITDALAGKTTPQLATDQHGNTYVQEQTLTRGQQWARIGGEILRGAAAGAAAGQGAGNMGKAAAAGVQVADQQQQQDQQQRQQLTAQARQQNIDNANAQMLRMQMANLAWKADRDKVTATQHDIDFQQGQEDRLIKQGGTDLGTVEHENDIDRLLKVNPDVMKDLIVNHKIELMPNIRPDGKVEGIRVFKMPDNFRQQLLPAGTLFHTYDENTHQYVEHHSSDPLTEGERLDYETAAHNAALGDKQKQQAAALGDAKVDSEKNKADEEAARAAEARSTVPKNRAEANRANAEAVKASAEADHIRSGGDDVPSLGEGVARGVLTLDQVPTKQRGQVSTYLTQHHPNLDQKSVVLNNDERKRADLATNSIHNLDTIDAIIKRRPDLPGKIQGLLTQGKTLTGTDDKDISDVNTALDNYALAATGAHGVRAGGAREDAKHVLLNKWKNGAGAIRSSIATARDSLINLKEPGKPRGMDGTPYVYNQQQQQQQQQQQPPAAPPQGKTHIMTSDGQSLYIDTDKLETAKQRDPKLQVIE